jgi:hypothetical protein
MTQKAACCERLHMCWWWLIAGDVKAQALCCSEHGLVSAPAQEPTAAAAAGTGYTH